MRAKILPLPTERQRRQRLLDEWATALLPAADGGRRTRRRLVISASLGWSLCAEIYSADVTIAKLQERLRDAGLRISVGSWNRPRRRGELLNILMPLVRPPREKKRKKR